MRPGQPVPAVLSVGDVGQLLGSNPKTVARWADTGLLESFRTPGGTRRIPRDQENLREAVAAWERRRP